MTSPPRERPRPVAGRVESVDPIPGADHVRLATVDVGSADPLVIVFGGTFQPSRGDVVPVAPPGSRVPGPSYDRWNPVKMRRRRYRGAMSDGMLCSLRELGWAEHSADRVPALRRDLEPGSPLPERSGWRHVVVEPREDEFGPNTVELSIPEMLREVRASSGPT